MIFQHTSDNTFLINDYVATYNDFGSINNGKFNPSEELKPLAMDKFGLKEKEYNFAIAEFISYFNH